MSVRLRYAPSPTGHLHIGGARTALFNYLYAKHMGGTFILRIEDTDTDRHVAQAAEEFAENLRWLGVEWDEGAYVGGQYGPYFCTERLPVYQPYAQTLLDKGLAYPCYCTAEELAQEREQMLAQGQSPQYSGRCRHLTAEQKTAHEAAGRLPAIRFRVASEDTVTWHDMIRGDMRFEAHSVGGDFVIVKSNGIPTYNFAVTIDDHLMEITHVIRGEEHISNTPLQIYLYAAFGWEPPVFGHVPLILGPSGKKLSKRDESLVQFIEQYKALGYLPEAVFNFLALLGWSPEGEVEILGREELVRAFSMDRVSRSGAFFDAAKLAWMNGQYIKQRDVEALVPLCRPYLAPYLAGMDGADAWISEFVALYKDKVNCLSDLPVQGRTLLQDELPWEADAQAALQQPHVLGLLAALLVAVKQGQPATADAYRDVLRVVQAETGHKGKELFMPVRAAVLRQLHGPDLPRSLALLGTPRVVQRLESALAFLHALG